ncbi:hypothetical protein GCM10011579_016310 [Streptomyces albiflavescens]|uniref:Uncharacterized protein n=1 Tax=Streptomyces albiflavescens TaxID=1623582 RepID=A0A918D0P2_9ACTN|nr:hypothetical protein GCM10011579_016310 [Streptomyces albiflavescens]
MTGAEPEPADGKRVPQLPTAAYDPTSTRRSLDLWAGLYVTIRNPLASLAAANWSSAKAEREIRNAGGHHG